MATNSHPKYTQALAVAAREGWRFTSVHPRSNILYYALLMSGYKWTPQTQEWQRWRQPYVRLQREAS